jgi:glycosyltransferase involved in cell wall biosynthesis
MSTPLPRLSVVCPAYQEEEVLPRFHAALGPVLDALAADYDIEVVYVDDGSVDGTLQVLRQLAAADRRVRYLSLSRNFGGQAALTAGLEHATGEVVVTLDSDLQHPPEFVPKLLENWKRGYDIVLTERVDSSDVSWFKGFCSRGFHWLLSRVSDMETHPASISDFRLLSRAALDALLSLRESHRYLRGMVNWIGFRVTRVAFQAAPRAAGRSSYTFRRLMKLASDGIVSFSSLPLRLPLFPGIVSTGIGLLYGAGSVLTALLAGGLSLWPVHLLLSVVFVLGGLILWSLGVLGEYTGRVFEQVKQRPVYLLKESSFAAARQGRALDRSLAA